YFDDRETDWEIGFSVREGFEGRVAFDDQRAMVAHTVPRVEQMACVIYEGSYIGLHQGYSALGTWIEQNGYLLSGDVREVFLHVDLESPDANITEIQYPVTRLEIPTTPGEI
ncbi:MAG: hypothetical protein ABI700_20280, partial [Chloroflexota bacterium]